MLLTSESLLMKLRDASYKIVGRIRQIVVLVGQVYRNNSDGQRRENCNMEIVGTSYAIESTN